MELHNKNHPETLPYEKLALLGIDREKADKLPQDVKQKLVSGEVTPLLQVSINARNGDVITLPLKLQMITDKNGSPVLIAYPVRLEMERDNILQLSRSEADRLKRGDVIRKEIGINGEKSPHYLQLDPETKSVIHKKTSELRIEEHLKDMEKVNDIELGIRQKQQVREGKPVELNVGGEKVSVGIDLKEPQGFKVIKGDMKEWERQQKIQYDEMHPEFLGLVMTDKNRWEYQQVVDRDSRERAIRLSSDKKNDRGSGLKL